LPELETLRQEFEPQGISFLALSMAHGGDLGYWAEKMGIRMRVGSYPGEVLTPLSITQVPATVFVDRNGVIVAAGSGPKSLGSLRRQARALLQ